MSLGSECDFDDVDEEMTGTTEMNASKKLSKNPIKLTLEDKICNLLMSKFPDNEGRIVSDVLPALMNLVKSEGEKQFFEPSFMLSSSPSVLKFDKGT